MKNLGQSLDNKTIVTRLINLPIDLQPNSISFSPLKNANPGTIVTSAAVTVSGLSPNTLVPISIRGGKYSINSQTFTSTVGSVKNGDILRLQHTTSASYSTSVTTSITVGGLGLSNNAALVLGNKITGAFTSTTKVAP